MVCHEQSFIYITLYMLHTTFYATHPIMQNFPTFFLVDSNVYVYTCHTYCIVDVVY